VKFLRTVLSVLLAGFALVLSATPAFAHTELKTSNPADGASLSTAPEKVTLTFGEAVTLPNNPISIEGPGDVSWTVGTPTINGASISAPVQPAGPAGQYLLHYAVIADDGDTVKGTVAFNLTTAAGLATTEATAAATAAPVASAVAAPAPTASAPVTQANGSENSASSAAGVWIAVVVVVLGVAAAAYAIARRRRAGSGTR